MISLQPIRNLGVTLNFRAQSGTPYNITAGADRNGDGVFNDRPDGVERNSARTKSQWDVGLRLSYAIGFGQRPQTAGGSGGGTAVVMIGGAGGGGGMPGSMGGGGAADKRFRVEFYRRRAEPHQPQQLHRLQRRHHVAVLRTADERDESAQDRDWDAVRVLICLCRGAWSTSDQERSKRID